MATNLNASQPGGSPQPNAPEPPIWNGPQQEKIWTGPQQNAPITPWDGPHQNAPRQSDGIGHESNGNDQFNGNANAVGPGAQTTRTGNANATDLRMPANHHNAAVHPVTTNTVNTSQWDAPQSNSNNVRADRVSAIFDRVSAADRVSANITVETRNTNSGNSPNSRNSPNSGSSPNSSNSPNRIWSSQPLPGVPRRRIPPRSLRATLATQDFLKEMRVLAVEENVDGNWGAGLGFGCISVFRPRKAGADSRDSSAKDSMENTSPNDNSPLDNNDSGGVSVAVPLLGASGESKHTTNFNTAGENREISTEKEISRSWTAQSYLGRGPRGKGKYSLLKYEDEGGENPEGNAGSSTTGNSGMPASSKDPLLVTAESTEMQPLGELRDANPNRNPAIGTSGRPGFPSILQFQIESSQVETSLDRDGETGTVSGGEFMKSGAESGGERGIAKGVAKNTRVTHATTPAATSSANSEVDTPMLTTASPSPVFPSPGNNELFEKYGDNLNDNHSGSANLAVPMPNFDHIDTGKNPGRILRQQSGKDGFFADDNNNADPMIPALRPDPNRPHLDANSRANSMLRSQHESGMASQLSLNSDGSAEHYNWNSTAGGNSLASIGENGGDNSQNNSQNTSPARSRGQASGSGPGLGSVFGKSQSDEAAYRGSGSKNVDGNDRVSFDSERANALLSPYHYGPRDNLPPPPKVKKHRVPKLNELEATAICGNDITASCFYVVGQLAKDAGVYAPLCAVFSSLVLYSFRKVYGEVVSALPLNGGIYNLLLNSSTRQKASVVASLTILSYLATAVVSAVSAMHYLNVEEHYKLPGSLWILLFFAVLMLSGIKESGRFASVLFVFHLCVLLYLVGACSILTIAHLEMFFDNKILSLMAKHAGVTKMSHMINYSSSEDVEKDGDANEAGRRRLGFDWGNGGNDNHGGMSWTENTESSTSAWTGVYERQLSDSNTNTNTNSTSGETSELVNIAHVPWEEQPKEEEDEVSENGEVEMPKKPKPEENEEPWGVQHHIFKSNLQWDRQKNSITSLFFGFSTAMLGVSGFETSANFVENQQKGVFTKTLRNMWVAVSFLNIILAFFVIVLVPIEDLTKFHADDAIAFLSKRVVSEEFANVVRFDAFMVLAGSVLTSYVGVCGLLTRMAGDKCLPQIFEETLPNGAPYFSITFFFAICAAMCVLLEGDIVLLSNMYSLAFLLVMAMFAFCGLWLKWIRPSLPRKHNHSAGWFVYGFISVSIAFVGAMLKNTDVLTYFLIFYLGIVIIVMATYFRVQLIVALANVLETVLATLGIATTPLGHSVAHLTDSVQEIHKQGVLFFTKTANLAQLNKVVLYILANEDARWLRIAHCYTQEADIPRHLHEYVQILDCMYPEIRIDLVFVNHQFGPAIGSYMAKKLNIPAHAQFISCPGPNFKYNLEMMGGVRVIVN